jgi:hypothetical protein
MRTHEAAFGVTTERALAEGPAIAAAGHPPAEVWSRSRVALRRHDRGRGQSGNGERKAG